MKVPAAYTSLRCSRCRSVDPESRESQAVYRCTRCGYSENADVNAAKNILAAGRAVTACGDLGGGRSAKQEPLAVAYNSQESQPSHWGGRQLVVIARRRRSSNLTLRWLSLRIPRSGRWPSWPQPTPSSDGRVTASRGQARAKVSSRVVWTAPRHQE
ncbi:zinc ribbon domain-containing protein [Nocardia sp. NPDC051787]|uniref:zinc ribbon domain-containing protein n=1 Tax=Nocardia sp. NPDC051787 TaxID=3155415 RepID=UPI0034449DDA